MLNIKAQLKKERLFTKKALGQHFLIDENILKRIVDVSGVGHDDVVLEIGAGVGNLTQFLVQQAKKVFAVEIDKRLTQLFKKNVSKDASVEHFIIDALKFDLEEHLKEFGGEVKVVANLPYIISSPMIFRLLKHSDLFSSFTLMLQKEVADRLASTPGTKEYGALTVMVGLYADVDAKFDVMPHSFFPQPKVASRIVNMTLLPESRVKVFDHGIFKQVVNASFGQRRKMLSNALKPLGGPMDVNMAKILDDLGIDSKRRGETLDTAEFAAVANAFYEKIKDRV